MANIFLSLALFISILLSVYLYIYLLEKAPPSPRLLSSIFILCDISLEASGTAFIISRNCLLSSYHNIATNPKNPTKSHKKKWKIVTGLERLRNGTICTLGGSFPIQVTVHKYCVREDWVILKRDNGLFDEDQVIPICPVAEIPVYGEEPNVRIYQCALDLFNGGFIDAIRPTSLTVKMGYCTNHKVFLQAGLFGGSSGAVYVIADPMHRGFGKAFGMHCESINTSKTVEDVMNEGEIVDPDAVIEEVTDSCVNSHASFVQGILISTYKNLMGKIMFP